MSASVSPDGFSVVRGRGYRPDQVERALAEHARRRDDAWERAARLTVLAREMEDEVARLAQVVAQLPPQTYEQLGHRAQGLLFTAQAEAAGLRERAEAASVELMDAAEGHARAVRDAAHEHAVAVRAEAEEWSRRALEAAEAVADDVGAVARREVKERREEALAALKEMRQRTAAVLADQEKGHAERWETAGREIAEREAALDVRIAAMEEYARNALAEAQRRYAEAEEAARHGQEDAEAQAAALISHARVREERVARDTERVLREHDERREELRAHMAHVRHSLAALTGKPVAEDLGAGEL
ncbi:cellulose-binding protein [Streptomyces albireticuli]|uniref:Cellulose-binding protein n=1 Tax=Streptomyces albireticuli TaxID=1940 RepID=A0A2A2DCD6_9ACTN|nr:cellulose-binding protein [Streptomyces albireticuli]MCD9144517.1 cellulose-binding protein [Streptomyces albireticuli]MCD9163420.1 cellulose-binding protein [Streptomyces albireticuli]MCD9193194.1 cellulose-binding protein [Streptomyces albireticuli]PAU48962.1 cellulose-binding protein [Streptomyces albireticuli]